MKIAIGFLVALVIFSPEISIGENIALGKKVIYSILPNAPKDDTNKSRLTDGIKSDSRDPKKVVGWGQLHDVTSAHGVFICIDLEQTQALKSAMIRLIADTKFVFRMTIPKKITVAVSKDGKNFYYIAAKAKVNSFGSHIPQGVIPFHVDENKVKRGYEIDFDLNGIDARYVGFRLEAEGFMFYADECEINSADKINKKFDNEIYKMSNRYPFFIGHGLSQTDKYFFGPQKNQLAVPLNMKLPTLLSSYDYRGGKDDSFVATPINCLPWKYCNNMEFVIDLPAGIKLL